MGGCFAGIFGASVVVEESERSSFKAGPKKRARRPSVISIRRKAEKADNETNLLEDCRWIYRLVCTEDVEKVYTLQRQLGEGGFATVWLAQHKEMGFERAVKKIPKKQGVCNSEILSEIYALMDLDHPHIIRLSRMYDGAKFLYIVSELCNGPSLYDRIKSGPMSEQEQGRAMRHILKAVHCCHAHYMGHYDLKPENFMYAEPDLYVLKMIDLGLSSNFMRESRDLKGTLRYMAPEMFSGIFGPEADIWSCGVIMYEMQIRSHMVPSSATSHDAVKDLVCNQKWVKLQREKVKTSRVSEDFMSLLAQLLRTDRHMRTTASSALSHPHILSTYRIDDAPSQEYDKSCQVMREMVTNFMGFASEPLLVRAVLLVMVHVVGYITTETRAHRRAYAMMDRKGVGEISQEAIEAALAEHQIDIPNNFQEAFSGVALHNGYIAYCDFLAATLPRSLRCREDLCRRSFIMMDHNRDGVIDYDDLESVFLSRDEKEGPEFKRLVRDAMEEAAGIGDAPKLEWDDFLSLVLGGHQVIPETSRIAQNSGF